jgi:hypothetical protein
LPTLFDERLEALHVAVHATRDEAELVAELLDEPLRLHVHVEVHAALALCEVVERDDATVTGLAVDRVPRDPLVG